LGRAHRPLLIGQGANDVRVKASESEQIVAAMQQHGIPVTYVSYPGLRHTTGRIGRFAARTGNEHTTVSLHFEAAAAIVLANRAARAMRFSGPSTPVSKHSVA
jgi:acetyl esterase/lipase